ncbi:hypothetical protein O2K51_13790 [Apibacter raozihei]|uniref:hypothetical protein n=1 Tax=Apibacter raozihei TaxID=2500547 RepID=UPI000FE2BD3E|nr:hypothetical protein [Apibacter raozihei]
MVWIRQKTGKGRYTIRKYNFKIKKQEYSIPLKTSTEKIHILGYVKSRLDAYIEAVKKVSPRQGAKIRYQDCLDFTNEKILRNRYVHWSATGKTGHGARSDNKRKIITG